MNKTVNPSFLIALVGPTTSGKTALAIKLARRFNGAIISADSRQIYQHAKIGTAQPVGKWRAVSEKRPKADNQKQKKIYQVNEIPHFLIDILPPDKIYSAAQYQHNANRLIRQLSTMGYWPIIVGGTGLYVSAVTENYNFPAGNKLLRNKLAKMSLNQLNQKLAKLDKLTHSQIDKSNRRRLARALEYVLATGQSFYAAQNRSFRPQTLIIGIKISPTKLKQNIARRTGQMIKRGLIKETKYLQKKYPRSVLLKTIGYREIAGYLDKKYNLTTAINLINTHTWQYARRQLTWFKKMPNIVWLKNYRAAAKLIKQRLALR